MSQITLNYSLKNEFEEDLSFVNLWKKRRRQYTLWLGYGHRQGFSCGVVSHVSRGAPENLITNLRLSRLILFLLIALEHLEDE
jgi:hypothetical protein